MTMQISFGIQASIYRLEIYRLEIYRSTDTFFSPIYRPKIYRLSLYRPGLGLQYAWKW